MMKLRNVDFQTVQNQRFDDNLKTEMTELHEESSEGKLYR